MFTSSLTNPSFSLLRTGGYINGQWTDAQDKATFDVTNPATGGLITRVSDPAHTKPGLPLPPLKMPCRAGAP